MRRGLVAASALVCLATVAAGCSSSTSSTSSAPPPTTASTPDYSAMGPDTVSVTTLDLGSAGALGERMATVYYPSQAGCLSGLGDPCPRFSYTASNSLPAAFQGLVPAAYNNATTVHAYVNLPASTKGPFPIVLFSHGYGGERLEYSHLLTGIASWGYVVVSADYLERGIAATLIKGGATWRPALDTTIMNASLAKLLAASADPTSVLHGVADPDLIAAIGHSQGGQTAFDELKFPHVKTAIGWAPVGPTSKPANKPVMLIGAEGDIVVKPSYVRGVYDSFPAEKSLIEISGEGHNTYTDICVGIRSGGGGIIGYAVAHHLVKKQLVPAALNGCLAKDLPAQRYWPIVQYYTVFQLKKHLDESESGQVPVAAKGAFPGFTVTVTQPSASS